MALVLGLPGYVSATSGVFGAGQNIIPSRFGKIVESGQVADGTPGGGLYFAGGFVCIQSTAALLNQVVSTADAVVGARASFIYIPVTTGPLVGSTGPAYQNCGTPLVWNDNLKQLMIWSSGSVSWMTLIATTSMAAGGFTTSA